MKRIYSSRSSSPGGFVENRRKSKLVRELKAGKTGSTKRIKVTCGGKNQRGGKSTGLSRWRL
jgi:hypothetical protein